MSTSPPRPALKKLNPSARSSRTKNCEAAMNGVAMTTSSEVEKFAQTSRGMRKKLIPVAIDDAPANWTPSVKNTWPIGAETDSGAYAVQPEANEPPGAKNEPSS